jgi:hypothetical protein
MFRGLFPHGTVEERLRTGLLVPSTRLHGFVSTRVYPSGRPVLEVNSVPIVIPRGYIRRDRYLFRMLVFMDGQRRANTLRKMECKLARH